MRVWCIRGSINIILVKRFHTVRREEITKTNLLITFSLCHLIPKLLGWILHYYSYVISFCFTYLAEVRQLELVVEGNCKPKCTSKATVLPHHGLNFFNKTFFG